MLSLLPLHQLLMAVAWLGVVVSLIFGASRAARFLPARLRQTAPPSARNAQENAIALRGSIALDLRRRVHLVEAAGQTTLILTGGTADVMLALGQVKG